jgi:hypothetical protein
VGPVLVTTILAGANVSFSESLTVSQPGAVLGGSNDRRPGATRFRPRSPPRRARSRARLRAVRFAAILGFMIGSVDHGFEHESIDAKVAWFASLSMAERLLHLDALYGLAVALNPKMREGSDLEPPSPAVRVLELPRS